MTDFDSIIRLDSPLGRIEVTALKGSIVGLDIERGGTLPHDGTPDAPSAVLDATAQQLSEYFSGQRREFNLPVDTSGTDFQSAVWQQLAAIPYGTVRSYGEVGASTGRPTAGRAVGGAVGANPVPIIIPCHRVLASDGRITGYSGGNGIPTKEWLLDLEGIPHR